MDEAFGSISKRVRGIVIYKLSPYEQRAFAGYFKHGVPNTVRRVAESLPYLLPMVFGTYFIYSEAEKEHKRLMRKNPADYEN
ncbi:cytochrome b-c1 complex subunit 8, partial [bacterium LRH843]|nr:cytochrome b-c1 complex subunit 8 [bacterium LRH843]